MDQQTNSQRFEKALERIKTSPLSLLRGQPYPKQEESLKETKPEVLYQGSY